MPNETREKTHQPSTAWQSPTSKFSLVQGRDADPRTHEGNATNHPQRPNSDSADSESWNGENGCLLATSD